MPTDGRLLGAIWWGFNNPGCFLWARVLESGRVHVVSELKFQKKHIEDVARDIKARTRELEAEKLSSIYGPPDIFPKPDGPVIEAESPSQTFSRFGVVMIPAGSIEQHGWQRIHDYLRDAPDGKPWLLIAPACQTLIRTLPSLVEHDKDKEDVVGDSYAAHALRVLLSARPHPTQMAKSKKPYAWGTVGWLRDDDKPRGLLSSR